MIRDMLLYRALHRFTRSGERWAELRATGGDDDAIRERVSAEFGRWATFGGPSETGAAFDGGPNPRFWVGNSHKGPPTLQGAELIAVVRKLMRIPPVKVESVQGSLFGEE